MKPFEYDKLIEVLRVLQEVNPRGLDQISVTDYSDYIYLEFSKIEFAELFYTEIGFALANLLGMDFIQMKKTQLLRGIV